MIERFVSYLHANEGFRRFMDAWNEKYVSLSHLGGTIVIQHPSIQEIDAISALLGLGFQKNNMIRINYKKMEKALALTKFAEVDFEAVLHLYFRGTIETKKSIIQKQNEQMQSTIENLKNMYRNTKAFTYLCMIEDEQPQMFYKFIKTTKVNQKRTTYILNAINSFPVWNKQNMSLAVFANLITKDPHFFDYGFGLKHLLLAIHYLLGNARFPKTQIEKNELLTKAGILKEETNNYISVYNVFMTTMDKKVNEGLVYYAKAKQSINLNLANIKLMEKVYETEHLLVIENPSVFEVLMQYLIDNQHTNIGLICTNGELNLAAYLMLNIIKESKVKTYYAGDFDPEGLLIAWRIYERLGDRVKFIGYNEYCYEKSKSQKVISLSRLEKINKTLCPELELMKKLLQDWRLVGYQESLISEYIKIINSWK